MLNIDMDASLSTSQKHILEFLSNHQVGVLATADGSGKPHAATIYIAHDEHLNFYFVTKKETQKHRNLQQNAQAAIALYDQESQTTVQASGQVSEVTDKDKIEGIISEIWQTAIKTSQSHIPPTSKLGANGYIVYMLSAPTVRIAKFSQPDPTDYFNIFETAQTEPS